MRDGADDATLAGEGFTMWEVSAARAFDRRERGHSPVPVALEADAKASSLTGAG